MSVDDPVRRNRAGWDAVSAAYQRAHGPVLARTARAWGVWRIPEAELRVLGPVRGRDVLELGCGAAQWTRALADDGARAVGVDLSGRQLGHARGGGLRLVQGDAERLPFRDAAFDVVFCDHGATSFARPGRAVAEASRVLRAGGLFAFCMATPLHDLCWDPDADRVAARLVGDYFALGAVDDGDTVTFQLPYGAWIRLFRAHRLAVEDLVELRPPPDASTTYAGFVPRDWARRWPAEHVWRLRKQRP